MTPTTQPFIRVIRERSGFDQWLHDNLEHITVSSPHCPLKELLPLLREAFEAGEASTRHAQEAAR